jgi:hypothetical protein
MKVGPENKGRVRNTRPLFSVSFLLFHLSHQPGGGEIEGIGSHLFGPLRSKEQIQASYRQHRRRDDNQPVQARILRTWRIYPCQSTGVKTTQDDGVSNLRTDGPNRSDQAGRAEQNGTRNLVVSTFHIFITVFGKGWFWPEHKQLYLIIMTFANFPLESYKPVGTTSCGTLAGS